MVKEINTVSVLWVDSTVVNCIYACPGSWCRTWHCLNCAACLLAHSYLSHWGVFSTSAALSSKMLKNKSFFILHVRAWPVVFFKNHSTTKSKYDFDTNCSLVLNQSVCLTDHEFQTFSQNFTVLLLTHPEHSFIVFMLALLWSNIALSRQTLLFVRVSYII